MRDRLAELAADPRLALSVSRAEAQELLVALAAVTEALRLAAASPGHESNDPEVGNKLVSADQLAEITAQPRRWFYSMARRKDWEAFTVRVSRGKLLFKQAGVERWLAAHGNRQGG
jgi:hypothetical protein